jgi:hypothetical protein
MLSQSSTQIQVICFYGLILWLFSDKIHQRLEVSMCVNYHTELQFLFALHLKIVRSHYILYLIFTKSSL